MLTAQAPARTTSGDQTPAVPILPGAHQVSLARRGRAGWQHALRGRGRLPPACPSPSTILTPPERVALATASPKIQLLCLLTKSCHSFILKKLFFLTALGRWRGLLWGTPGGDTEETARPEEPGHSPCPPPPTSSASPQAHRAWFQNPEIYPWRGLQAPSHFSVDHVSHPKAG